MADTAVLTCEAKCWGTGKPCHHRAKYLVLWDSMIVCGIHNRGFLRGIPLSEIDPHLYDGQECPGFRRWDNGAMTDAEALRWLRYALAWMPKDVWEDLKRDAEYPKVQEAIAHVEAAQQSDGSREAT